MNDTIGCVIPVYNHFDRVGEIVPIITRYIPSSAIVIVDDGSKESYHKENMMKGEMINIIRHSQNMGKGAALKTGMHWLQDNGFSQALCLDADGQHDPDDIPKFIQLAGKADIIIGNRMKDLSTMPFHRRVSNLLTSAFIRRKSHLPVKDSQNGFRLVNIAKILSLDLSASGFQFESEMLILAGKNGFSLLNVPVKTLYNDAPSSINHLADTYKFIRLMLK